MNLLEKSWYYVVKVGNIVYSLLFPNFMIDVNALNAEIQALADKYQVEIIGKAVPISPDEDDFDIKATPQAAGAK